MRKRPFSSTHNLHRSSRGGISCAVARNNNSYFRSTGRDGCRLPTRIVKNESALFVFSGSLASPYVASGINLNPPAATDRISGKLQGPLYSEGSILMMANSQSSADFDT